MTNPTLPPVPSTIANLPAVGAVTSADFIPLSQNGVTYKSTAAQFATIVQAASIVGSNGISASTTGGVTTVSGITATSLQIGVSRPDGTTITASGGVLSAVPQGITVGTTTISSGTNGFIEFNNNGVLGELATTGSGNVVRATSPTLITPTLGVATATSLNFGGTTLATYATGTWIPADNSGAALALTVTSASYTKIGRLVLIELNVTYPSTANGNTASISGLPFTSAGNVYVGTIASTYSGVATAVVAASTTALTFNSNPVGTPITNANLSTRTSYITIMYEATTN